jgi:3-keto-disaccharide hydrolase
MIAGRSGEDYADRMKTALAAGSLVASLLLLSLAAADDSLPKAFIDGNGPGWRALGEADFVNVNCAADTWSFKDGKIQCTGTPTGVMRMKEPVTNFELVVQWMHQKPGGNSGVFVWASEESIKNLHEGKHNKRLPDGVEVQILDHAFRENYEKKTGKKGEFFTTNGDVFPTGTAKLKPFEPTSPNGQRSFPRKELTRGAGEWNHYYVRGINGEVRLWVNGEEVSGGSGAQPPSGYLCLESEGSPIEFKNLRIRLLP